MPEPIEDLPPNSVIEEAIDIAVEARGGGCIHLREDLVWGQDFYESLYELLGLTPAQLTILDGAGYSKVNHKIRAALDSMARKGRAVHIRHNVWMFPKKDQSPESSDGLGWVPRRRPINAVRDRLCWVRL